MTDATADVVIYGTDSDVPDSDPDPIVIEQLIREFDESVANDLLRRLTHIDFDHEYDVPVYDIFSHQVWRDGGQLHEESPFSMELLVLLYRRLEPEVATADRIETVGVGGRFLDLVRDLAANEGVALVVKDQPTESITDGSVRRDAFKWVPVVLFDMFVSLIIRVLLRGSTAAVLVLYPAFRPETFRPIESHLDVDYDGTFPVLTLSYLKTYRSLFSEGMQTVPIHCFETVRGFVSQCRFSLAFARDIRCRRTERLAIDAVQAETGIRLDRTVGTLYHRAAASNFAHCLRYGCSRRAFERTDYETLLVPSSGGLAKAIALGAQETGVDVFLLPHTIYHQYAAPEACYPHARFVEGTITREPVGMADEVDAIETGLPKLLSIRDRATSLEPTCDADQIVVGTQPYDDDRRREFVSDVVLAALTDTDFDVVIKIHPAEHSEFYEALLTELELSEAKRDRVRVTDGDLYQLITDSELMVTISSNVGLESVILGTPTISYNKWAPDIRTPLYATLGSVPHITAPAELSEFLSELELSRLLESQDQMLDRQYLVRHNSLGSISETIANELRSSVDGSATESLESRSE